jgi:demethylmenaquinone methyltransferase/2-methoxy-6-polyprenyl-1,4-benzoquinol methylase
MPAIPDAPTREGHAVQAMFDRISRRYRLANTVLSVGMDRMWRRRAAALVRDWKPRRVLDVATGTGDLARAIENFCPGAEVTGCDFSPQMLQLAKQLGSGRLVEADALSLPFQSAEFDVVTVAFGLRNMQSWEKALQEMARVLAPGGHLIVLDFSVPNLPLRWIYLPYLHHVLPRLAGWITGEAEAYRYLGDSIELFPQGSALCDCIKASGFSNAHAEELSGGIVTLYRAERL